MTLAVQHDRVQPAAELRPLLHDLSWERIEVGGGRPSLSLTVHRDDHRLRVPPTAREVFQAEGFRGLACDDEFYLTDGASLLHLQVSQGRGEAWLAPAFVVKPRLLQRTFWAFGLLKLLRPLRFFSLHAAGALSAHEPVLLIIGRSGSGKSTLALGLLRQGWSVLSDDAVLLRRQPEGIEALACRKHVYVHAEAAARHADLPLEEEVPDGAGDTNGASASERPSRRSRWADVARECCCFRTLCRSHRAPCAPCMGPRLLSHSLPIAAHKCSTARPCSLIWRFCGGCWNRPPPTSCAGRDLYEEPRTLVRLLREAEGAARWADS